MHNNTTTRASSPLAQAVSDALLSVTLEKRWLLANKVKALGLIKTGEVVPTRIQLAAIASVTGVDFSAFEADLSPVDWDSTSTAGETVRTLREALGWSREVLAAHCDVDVSAISRIEAGRTTPRKGTVAKLAAAAALCDAPAHAVASLGVRAATDDEGVRLIGSLNHETVTPDTVIGEVAVGRWLAEKKREMEAGTCDAAIKAALVDIGIVARRDAWNDRYNDLAERQCPESGVLRFGRSDPLEPWVSDQRRAYAAGSMPGWKVQALESVIGWRWGTTNQQQWNQTFQRVATAIDGAELTCVKRSWRSDDGFECGDWLSRARSRNAAAPVTAVTEQRAVLLAALPPSC